MKIDFYILKNKNVKYSFYRHITQITHIKISVT